MAVTVKAEVLAGGPIRTRNPSNNHIPVPLRDALCAGLAAPGITGGGGETGGGPNTTSSGGGGAA